MTLLDPQANEMQMKCACMYEVIEVCYTIVIKALLSPLSVDA